MNYRREILAVYIKVVFESHIVKILASHNAYVFGHGRLINYF